LSAPSRALLDGFLNRDPSKRLGCGPNGKTDIKRHPFFDRLDWAKLEARQIPPPFKPNIKNPKEATNFDSEFTQADPNFTPVNPTTIKGIDQDLFNGFSFVNPTFGNFRGAAAPAPVAGGGPSAGNSRTGNYDQVILRDEPSAGGGSSLAALAPPPAPSASGYVDLRRYKWYRPDIPRQDVAAHLKGKPPGTFFVRESSSQPGCYALAMEVGGDKPWNGLITPTVDQEGVTRYRLFVAKKFNNLPELITHYSQNVVTADARGRDICLLLP
jgi:classical protein kinase C beta type